MSDSKEHMTPEEARRRGLELLEAQHPHHPTTEKTPAVHESGPKWDETPNEAHRAGPLPYEKK